MKTFLINLNIIILNSWMQFGEDTVKITYPSDKEKEKYNFLD